MEFMKKMEKNLNLTFFFLTSEYPSWKEKKEKAEIIESQLKKVGISVKLSIVDTESYYDIL
ncbi:hypothetical protein STRIC_1220 [Streptococcus ictaluri 707-05]|uniref:Uncharacterized protein n=1 Tax=Streptococcus ictaluri 707-05 TaxID=764299 RepID=G5K352_9STRE|nr:hypothetical protein STRIC_1220 [Streptococcus ictaluri 707-05]